jgi:hypothetical protein
MLNSGSRHSPYTHSLPTRLQLHAHDLVEQSVLITSKGAPGVCQCAPV